MSASTTTYSRGEVLFTLTNNQSSSAMNVTNLDSTSNEVEEASTAEERGDSLEPESILCVLWKNGRIGAAYYKINDKQMYVLEEIVDVGPEFVATRSLYREVNPIYTVTMGSPCNDFVQLLIKLANNDDDDGDDSSASSMRTTTLPPNLFLLGFREYIYDTCENAVLNLRLPSEPENATGAQKAIFLHSLVDFDNKLSVHALGALIRFTQKNWAHLNIDAEEELQFLHINQISLANSVFLDQNTFNGLSVFQVRAHDAKFKHGLESSNREGYSVYKILAQHCKSKLGVVCLRNILTNPIKDMEELNKRMDFIEFAMVPSNQAFIDNLQNNIKKLWDVNKILKKIQYSRANSREWETLYNTIYHILFLNEMCRPHRAASQVLRSLDASVSAALYDLQFYINNALDFTSNVRRNRPIIKFGLDAELDAKELRKQDMTKNVTAAANFVLNQLPAYLQECSVVHVPEIGHLVVVKEWEPGCDRNQLQSAGFQFIFKVNELLHYKNAMCLELDKQLGDIHQDILAHENRIIQRLTEFVLRYNKDIREPLKALALIDCLISMSRVAKENGYVRPHLNQDGVHEIVGGRHLLQELICSNFVPNDYRSGGNHSRVKIITGPNASGKSVYLKQTALIIYLAHVGSFVPAQRANISMVHSIHSRIHATESAGVSLSAFMLDLSQTSQALHNAQSSSLIILDEFGRGTTGDDGFALLVAVLKKFCSQREFCPHVLVSTHVQQICQHLPQSRLVSHLKMDHTMPDLGNLVFLYNVVEGVSNSYAFEVAAAADLDEDIIVRAREIYRALYAGKNLTSSANYNAQELDLFDVKIPEPDD